MEVIIKADMKAGNLLKIFAHNFTDCMKILPRATNELDQMHSHYIIIKASLPGMLYYIDERRIKYDIEILI